MRSRRAARETDAERTGRFVSVLCLATPDGRRQLLSRRGRWRDGLAAARDLGFGYDPVFRPDGHSRTFGEMTAEEKHGWKPGQATATVAPRARLQAVCRTTPGCSRHVSTPSRSTGPTGSWPHPQRYRRNAVNGRACTRHRQAGFRRSICTGRSVPPNAPIAISTAMCAMPASTSRPMSRLSAAEIAAMRAVGPQGGHQHVLWRRHAVADGPKPLPPFSMRCAKPGWCRRASRSRWRPIPSSVEAGRFRGYRAGGRQPGVDGRAGTQRCGSQTARTAA
jgi:hypothetical protein